MITKKLQGKEQVGLQVPYKIISSKPVLVNDQVYDGRVLRGNVILEGDCECTLIKCNIQPRKTNKIYHPRGLQFSIVYGCNLKCPQCFHGSHFDKGYVSVDDFVTWNALWSQRIIPKNILISGGEPLLHPFLSDILQETKRIWDGVRILIGTNGTLTHKLTPVLLDALKGITLVIGVKPYKEIIGKDYSEQIKNTIKILVENKIKVSTRNQNYTQWLNTDLSPPKNSPEIAFGNCLCKRCEQPIDNGKLYQCTTLWAMQRMYNMGAINWNGLMDHEPLSIDCTEEELMRSIEHKNPGDYCKFCQAYRHILYPMTEDFQKGHYCIN